MARHSARADPASYDRQEMLTLCLELLGSYSAAVLGTARLRRARLLPGHPLAPDPPANASG